MRVAIPASLKDQEPEKSNDNAWYQEVVVPEATAEEIAAIKPYIAVLYFDASKYVVEHSPKKAKANVFLAEETFAHIFFHSNKQVHMGFYVQTSYKDDQGNEQTKTELAYDWMLDWTPFFEKHMHTINVLQSTIAKDRKREARKRLAALEQRRKRQQRQAKLIQSLHQSASMLAEAIEQTKQAVDVLAEASMSISFVASAHEQLILMQERQRLIAELDRAREEYRQAVLEKERLEREKSTLQKAKEMVQKGIQAAKDIGKKAIDTGKSLMNKIFGFGDKGKSDKTDSKGDKSDTSKGNDTGGPEL